MQMLRSNRLKETAINLSQTIRSNLVRLLLNFRCQAVMIVRLAADHFSDLHQVWGRLPVDGSRGATSPSL